jgi:hypothetical protein
MSEGPITDSSDELAPDLPAQAVNVNTADMIKILLDFIRCSYVLFLSFISCSAAGVRASSAPAVSA